MAAKALMMRFDTVVIVIVTIIKTIIGKFRIGLTDQCYDIILLLSQTSIIVSFWTPEPPLRGGAGERGIAPVHPEIAIIVSPIVARFEEVCASVVPLKGSFHVSGKTPKRYILGI